MEHDKPTKQAIVMIAKDGEHMAIYGNCDCSGKVNIYLARESRKKNQNDLIILKIHQNGIIDTFT